MNRPPLGVTPKYIWIEKRKQELGRAIYEYLTFNPQSELVNGWIKELSELYEWEIKIKEIIESVLLEFMDGTCGGFGEGHFTHSVDPIEVRNKLLEALKKVD